MVSLIGAGPGDAGLITAKAVERLKTADIVFYDRLANSVLLQYCKSNAEMYFVGKEAKHHYVKQEETIKLMIEAAVQGKNVVRLKGGDPFVFGRGSEEAMALRQAGIKYEIVPGITAGIAAPAYAGIPVTHRSMVTKCVFITAHEDPGKKESQNDWREIAQLTNTTIVVYMGVGNAPEITKLLIKEGMDADMPVAIIENGTYTRQRTFVTSLGATSETIHSNNIKPPSIFVIGPTVLLKQELDWFEQQPLFGVRIAATRAADQIHSLCSKLSELGAEIIPFSVIATELSVPEKSIAEILSNKQYDWLLFTSENGVRYFFELLDRENLDARVLSGIKIASIGKGTASRLKEYNIKADFIPQTYTSEALLNEFPEQSNIRTMKFLRVKGNFRNDFLVDELKRQNAEVDTVDVYKILKVSPDESEINKIINDGCDAVTFTSQSTVNNFISVFGIVQARKLFAKAVPFAIGPVTAKALDEQGISNYKVAEIHTIDGIVKEIIKYFNENSR